MYTIPTFGKRNPIERKQMIPRRTWQDTETTLDPFSIGNNVLETARGLATRSIFLPLRQPFLALFPETSVSHAPPFCISATDANRKGSRSSARERKDSRSRAAAPFPGILSFRQRSLLRYATHLSRDTMSLRFRCRIRP